jgi:sarcosine oxidase
VTESERADVLVVGLGAMGSAVTLRLAERGLRVIGIDRLEPPHDQGSTHGQTRITRLAVGEGAEYVPFVRRAHELWREIEASTGISVFEEVGGLVIGDPDDGFLQRTRAVATLHGVAHRNLSTSDLESRYPMFDVPAGTEAYLEPEAGYVRPEAAITAQLRLARDAGAVLRMNDRIRSWTATTNGVTARTTATTLEADVLVLCAGSWITKLVPESAPMFAIHPQTLHWFEIRRGYEELRRMPIFVWEMGGDGDPFSHLTSGFYGFPAIDGPGGGVKLATEHYDTTVDPDDRAAGDGVGEQTAVAMYARYLARYFPWVSEQSVRTVSCLYTCTRGSRFVIDRHTRHPNVWLVSPCSGHGFKHSPAIGEAVAQSIADGGSKIDLSPFALGAGLDR